MTAKETVTTGSNVESMEAVAGPIRLRPARNVTMPTTVEIRAIEIIEIHTSILLVQFCFFFDSADQDESQCGHHSINYKCLVISAGCVPQHAAYPVN